MADLAQLRRQNAQRWNDAVLTRGPEFARYAKIAVANKARYQDIEARTGVPWVFVAVVHYRECSQDFTKNIGQGDPLGQKTVRVPAGRGPFRGPKAFEDAAVDALMNCAPYAARNKDWSVAGMLTYLERYNGLAYANAGRPSPYIWSGTNQYKIGKVRRDHGPIEPVVDKQLGCAGLILAIMALDPGVSFSAEPRAARPPAPITAPTDGDAAWLQTSLNALGTTPELKVDGIIGSATRTAVRAFQRSQKLRVDGIAGKETVTAVRRALAKLK